MVSKREKERAKFRKLAKLEAAAARARSAFFILSDVEDATGYWWELVGPNDETICSSQVFHNKADCLKSLRVVHRHAATAPVRDDER